MINPAAALLMLVVGSCSAVAADAAGKVRAGNGAESGSSFTTAPVSQQMKITVGSQVFNATLENNKTAAAFRALLPLTLVMHDVNDNEKAFDLPSRLASADVNPRAIRNGDLMLWSSRTVVLFYKSFSTPYSYTRLGRLDDPEGLAAAAGTGDVTVKFELQ